MLFLLVAGGYFLYRSFPEKVSVVGNSVEKSFKIMETVEEPDKIETPETSDKRITSGASVLKELKLPGDFQDIDPECVDTPAFYGGDKSFFII